MKDWRAGPDALRAGRDVARGRGPDRAGVRGSALVALEIVLAVAAASGGVAALQSSTPVDGLAILYLLAVLAVAIRRGEVPALITAARTAARARPPGR
jgi:K+-sensing histidine kinase KdpD